MILKNVKIPKLILSIFVCHLAGIFGSIFTVSSIPTWYSTLARPEFSPPNWVFAPVWLSLYTLMGVSLYLVLEAKKSKFRKTALSFFGIQLLLNAVWSYLFFGLQNPFYALVEIVFLWAFILFTAYYFYKISKKSAYLLIPYLLWVSFAAILNYFIFILN
ncbi:tryptophan-rich sensory protein [Candidatus Micrarchaeota archaeon]|nr:tryptophan-rich sensory protein [Candidatus Micrarchaeota archaeon]